MVINLLKCYPNRSPAELKFTTIVRSSGLDLREFKQIILQLTVTVRLLKSSAFFSESFFEILRGFRKFLKCFSLSRDDAFPAFLEETKSNTFSGC